MPVDPSLSDTPSQLHGSAKLPYPCHAWDAPPSASWALSFGYCRHSLDVLSGLNDPRCPATCPHKAPETITQQFDKLFHWRGAQAAAEWARAQR
jgi:hypothetical protein